MKVKFGALMVDARGKAGGTVFSKNKSGSYAKNKVTPTNPRTASQSVVRAKLSVLAQQWRTLSEDEQNQWRGLTDAYQKKNIFGDSYSLSANMLFNSLNLNLSKVNIPPITSPLAPIGTQNVELVGVSSLTYATCQVELSTPLNSQNRAVILGTASFSAGIKNFKTRLREVAVLDTSAGASVDIYAEYSAKFGNPLPGSRIGFAIVIVNIQTGESSTPQYVSALVA